MHRCFYQIKYFRKPATQLSSLKFQLCFKCFHLTFTAFFGIRNTIKIFSSQPLKKRLKLEFCQPKRCDRVIFFESNLFFCFLPVDFLDPRILSKIMHFKILQFKMNHDTFLVKIQAVSILYFVFVPLGSWEHFIIAIRKRRFIIQL